MCTSGSNTDLIHSCVFSGSFRVQSFWNVIIIRLDGLLGVKTEWEFGEKWNSNIKERVWRGWGENPQLREWATEAAMCAGAAVKSAWSNRFCLSGTTTSESNWKSGGDLERAVDSEREKKKMSKKSNTVCSTVWQSRRVFRSAFNKVNGDFSPQAPFYCKSVILARFISVISLSSFSVCLCSLHLLSLWLLYLLLLHIISVFLC